jgi:hypothetical protein
MNLRMEKLAVTQKQKLLRSESDTNDSNHTLGCPFTHSVQFVSPEFPLFWHKMFFLIRSTQVKFYVLLLVKLAQRLVLKRDFKLQQFLHDSAIQS